MKRLILRSQHIWGLSDHYIQIFQYFYWTLMHAEILLSSQNLWPMAPNKYLERGWFNCAKKKRLVQWVWIDKVTVVQPWHYRLAKEATLGRETRHWHDLLAILFHFHTPSGRTMRQSRGSGGHLSGHFISWLSGICLTGGYLYQLSDGLLTGGRLADSHSLRHW